MTTPIPIVRRRRRRWIISLFLLAAMIATSGYFYLHQHRGNTWPNLAAGVDTVSCAQAHDVANSFATAVFESEETTPDYSGVRQFGFTPPINPGDVPKLRAALTQRQQQLEAKAADEAAGTCGKHDIVTGRNGQRETLPVVGGGQPSNPLSGSQTNKDPRTVPVTIGTVHNGTRTNSWTMLDAVYGNQAWYRQCASTNLGMHWQRDVPRFEHAEEKGHDTRFILAVNVDPSLTDAQIRQRAAADGNPLTGKLLVVRTSAIINTRNLTTHRCDQFVDTRSQIRVSLGKVRFDRRGRFAGLMTSTGSFVDCHNLWRLPKSAPSPSPSGHKPSRHPSHQPTCAPIQPGGPPACAKNLNGGPGRQGNVPTSVLGKNPPSSPEPRPNPPPPSSSPTPTRSILPPQSPAPQPSDPATGCNPPPGGSC